MQAVLDESSNSVYCYNQVLQHTISSGASVSMASTTCSVV